MSSEVVFDASAILVLLQRERGAEKLTGEILKHAVASTVNLAEVQSKLVKLGDSPDAAWEDALSTVVAAEPFTSQQAKIAGTLIATTQSYGLSLGDRSCLALAIELKAPVYTTERIWKNLKVGIPIHVIR
jgi:PIN domain nuclease of toxin-antitoxin system